MYFLSEYTFKQLYMIHFIYINMYSNKYVRQKLLLIKIFMLVKKK